jgi:hypothetical protein
MQGTKSAIKVDSTSFAPECSPCPNKTVVQIACQKATPIMQFSKASAHPLDEHCYGQRCRGAVLLWAEQPSLVIFLAYYH